MNNHLELPWSMKDTIENMKDLKQMLSERIKKANYDGKGETDAEEIKFDFDRAISALEKQLNGGWIPVSERLPNKREFQKNNGRFIVTDGMKVYQSLFDIYDNKCFVDITYIGNCKFNETIDNCVTAWQPLPEPYNEVEE